jgi:hypothetical protein
VILLWCLWLRVVHINQPCLLVYYSFDACLKWNVENPLQVVQFHQLRMRNKRRKLLRSAD